MPLSKPIDPKVSKMDRDWYYLIDGTDPYPVMLLGRMSSSYQLFGVVLFYVHGGINVYKKTTYALKTAHVVFLPVIFLVPEFPLRQLDRSQGSQKSMECTSHLFLHRDFDL